MRLSVGQGCHPSFRAILPAAQGGAIFPARQDRLALFARGRRNVGAELANFRIQLTIDAWQVARCTAPFGTAVVVSIAFGGAVLGPDSKVWLPRRRKGML